MSEKTSTVHVVFKTHLDLGFTDLAERVLDTYIDTYLPKALDTVERLREDGSGDRFVWTTGSWLVDQFLERTKGDLRRRTESAIAAGDLVWHALPFTTHSEAMTAELFRAGLTISARLDRRFGRNTCAGKMTDVPGHCRAIIPILADAGVRFLHIGCNGASTAPSVPSLFRWVHPDGASIVVCYGSDYGEARADGINGFEDELCFAHTNDNKGPQSAEEVRPLFKRLRETRHYKNVQGSTLDAFAHALLPFVDQLPEVHQEIGDTWIHGIGSDPRKMAEFRLLGRLYRCWCAGGSAREEERATLDRLAMALLPVAEHTWGMDEKTHLGDYANYTVDSLRKARERDVVQPESCAKVSGILLPAAGSVRRFSEFESSWAEQRRYVDGAVEVLKGSVYEAPTQAEMATLSKCRQSGQSKAAGVVMRANEAVRLGGYTVAVDAENGSLTRLRDERTGREWATKENPLGLVQAELFSAECYQRFYSRYIVKPAKHGVWAIPDFTKPGIEHVCPDMQYQCHHPVLTACCRDGERLLIRSELRGEAVDEFGLPRSWEIEYLFGDGRVDISVRWTGMAASRWPMALWCGFRPVVADSRKWLVNKMGDWISPLDVVARGGRSLHAIDEGIAYHGDDGTLRIDSLDAVLVSPGRPRILEFDFDQPRMEDGMYFNLYNNLWGTNFRMWNEKDAAFRFVIVFDAKRQ